MIAMDENKINECPVPKGQLLIIGGSENKGEEEAKEKQTPQNFERLEILKCFLKLLSKQEPVIEVITTATDSGEETFQDYKKVFKELKVKHVGQIHHNTRKEAMEDADLIDRIKKVNGIFFAGGDQLKYTSIYGGTPFLTFLKERYIYEKFVIAGTSAGAMVLSTPMIYAGSNEVQELGGMIKVTTGLEFLKDVLIDTHFVHRGRIVRMAQVIVTNPTSIGIGIEEDTAIIVRNGLDIEVVGSGTIIILDGHNITEANMENFTDEKPVSIRDLRMHILSGGDHYKIPQNNPPHI
jgi:cyanophycinase